MTSWSPAQQVLQELGITDPREIDLDAIAWHLGARITFCVLDGCEARIIGYKGHAIIRVDSRRHPRRQRFSVAHELGHWCHHRGRMSICRSEDIGSNKSGAPEIERVADRYAADLLLPRYIFDPLSREYSKLSFGVVRKLADLFDTSVTATAIRFVEGRHSPAILICHGHEGRKWFNSSPDVPERWFPRADLDHESFAFDLLFGNAKEQSHPRLIGAEAWFDRNEAQQYELREHSVRTIDGEILTLLLLTEDEMLEDRGSSQTWRR